VIGDFLSPTSERDGGDSMTSKSKKDLARSGSADSAKPSKEQKGFFIEASVPVQYPRHTERGGKWLLFVDRERVDEVWQKVCDALAAGRLGDCAKVSTARPNPNSTDSRKHVICVYTYDSEDSEDVMRIRASLRKLGFVSPIAYKTDQATDDSLYKVRGNRRVSKYYE
jgi:Domain of unknown function (DUF1917)